MASVIDRSSNQVGVSNPTVPGNIDDRPRSRSLATALFEGARASGCAYVELHHSKGHDPGGWRVCFPVKRLLPGRRVNWGTLIYLVVLVLLALNVAALYWLGQLLIMW